MPPGDEATWQFLGQRKELGLALAADRFMPYGTIVILIGGLLSTISALNATTYSSTRVSFAMGRDKVLPDAFAKIHNRFKTPYVALGATGVIIVFMVVAIPIEDVAAAADVMFLLLFLQVNFAVIRIRNEFGDRLEYGYRMPFYPWVPVIGIVTMALLAVYLFQFSPLAWLYAGGWIVVGAGVFVGYARGRVSGADEPRITYEDKQGMRSGRSILAPVANPRRVDTVVRVAAALAAARDTEATVLNVVRIPRTMPIAEGRGYTRRAEPVIEAARALDEDLPDVQLSTVVGIGRKVSTVINTTAQREDADLIVVGWHGAVREGSVRGSVVQEVLRTADRDVVVVKDHGLPDRIDEVLVGAKPGLHAGHTLDLAADLAAGFDANLRVVSVARPGDDQTQTEQFLTGVREHLADRLPAHRVRVDAVASDDVTATFAERARSSELVVIGASRDWVLSRTLLGEFADGLANRIGRSVVTLRPDESRPRSLWRQAIAELRRRSHRSP